MSKVTELHKSGASIGDALAEALTAVFAGDGDEARPITVSDPDLLFKGEYKRSGHDLVITDERASLIVHDYFRGQKRSDLQAPNGAVVEASTVEILAGPQNPGQYAQAAPAPTPASGPKVIGRIEKVSGTATATRNGVAIELNAGDLVYENDAVQTGSDGSLGISFLDGTAFSLSASARMILNKMVYDASASPSPTLVNLAGGGSQNSSLLTLVQGKIHFVAGQIAKTGDMKVNTPVATIGIRGTAVDAEIDAASGEVEIALMREPDGRVGVIRILSRSTGQVLQTITSADTKTVITPQAGAEPRFETIAKTPAELAAEASAVANIFQIQFMVLQAPIPQQGNQQDQGQQQNNRGEPNNQGQPNNQNQQQNGPGQQNQNGQDRAQTRPSSSDPQLIRDASATDATKDLATLNSVTIPVIADQSLISGTALLVAQPVVSPPIAVQSPTDTSTPVIPVSNPPTAPSTGTPGVVMQANADGGNDITLSDPSVLTAAMGTQRTDKVVFFGSGQLNLPENIENATLTGTSDSSVTGNDLSNTLEGNSGNNTLYAQGGDDAVYGGDGDDVLVAGRGEGNDLYDGGPGTNTVTYTSTSQGIHVDLMDGTGSGSQSGIDRLIRIQNVTGGSGNDTILGDVHANVLRGEGGNDTISGGEGEDTLLGGAGDDSLAGGNGRDALIGGAGSDTLDGGNANDELEGGGGDDTLRGGEGTNTAVLSGNRSEYKVVQTPGGFQVIDLRAGSPDGTDILTDIQFLRFADGTFKLNRAPVAANDVKSTGKNTALTFAASDLLANDSDVDSAGLTVTSVGSAANGSVSLVDGRITYTPNVNFVGFDTFTYTVSDADGGTTTASVIVQSAETNDAPVAQAASNAGAEDGGAITGSVAATDADGDSLTYSLVQGPSAAQGTLTFSEAGSYSFTPAGDFNGTVTFTYRASDGLLASNVATVTLTVTPVNDAPVVAIPLADRTSPEDTAWSFQVPAGTFLDVDSASLAYTVRLEDGTAQGAPLPAWLNFDAATRTFSGTPPHDFTGTLALRVTATDGALVASDTFNLTITNANDPPALTGTKASLAAGTEDAAYIISAAVLLQGFSDVDGDTLSVSGLTATNGTLVDNNNGTWTFTPASNVNGTVQLTYAVIDGKGGSVAASQSFTLTPVNDAPTAAAVNLGSVPDGATLRFTAADLLEGVSDVDGPAPSITSVGLASGAGELVRNEDGSFTYVRAPDETGPVSFTYTVSDGFLTASGTATAVLEEPANRPPELSIQPPGPNGLVEAGHASEGVGLSTATIAASDPDGDAVAYDLSGWMDGAVQYGGHWYRYVAFDDGQQRSWHAAQGIATAMGGYLATITSRGESDFIRDNVILGRINPGDTAFIGGSDAANEGVWRWETGPEAGTVFGTSGTGASPFTNWRGGEPNDYGSGEDYAVVESDGTWNDVPNPYGSAGGFLVEMPAITYWMAGLYGSATFDPITGRLTYTLDNDSVYTQALAAGASATDSFDITATDGNGGSTTRTVTFQITGANDAPETGTGWGYGYENQPEPIAVGLSGWDIDGAVARFRITALAGNGTLYRNAGLTDPLALNELVAASDGGAIIYFVPIAGWHGSTTFAYAAEDDHGVMGTPAVGLITIYPQNDAPTVTVPGAQALDEDEAIIFLREVGTEISFDDIDSETLTVSLSVSHGTLWLGSSENVTILAGADGTDAITFFGTKGAVNAAVQALVYQGTANYNGADRLTITASDGNGGIDTATVELAIAPVNDAPVVAIPLADRTSPEDTAWSFQVPAGTFLDVDSASLAYTVRLEDGTAQGAPLPAWLNFDAATRTFSGTPPHDFTGTLALRVTATDGALVASDTFNLTITNANDPPETAAASTEGPEDAAAILVSLAGSDSDGSVASFTIVSVPANGTLYADAALAVALTVGATVPVTGAGATVYFVPGAHFAGLTTFQYAARDNEGLSDGSPATATITVTPVNDAPTGAVTIAGALTQGQTLTANTATLADADGLGAFSYVWKAGGTVIAGATRATYTLTQAEVGKTITVEASYTDGQGTRETVTSTATAPVTEQNEVPTFLLPSAGVFVRVSNAADGSEADGASYNVSLSTDGRFVAFNSEASDLIHGASGGGFLLDRSTGDLTLVSVNSAGEAASDLNGYETFVSVSGNGASVALLSSATNLATNDYRGTDGSDVFVRNLTTGSTSLASIRSRSNEGPDGSSYLEIGYYYHAKVLSDNGRYVAFQSDASNLVGDDGNGSSDVFVRDVLDGITERVSVAFDGGDANSVSGFAVISADGRSVAFQSYATNLIAGGAPAGQIYVRNLDTGVTKLVSVNNDGEPVNGAVIPAAISGDGRYVVYAANASNFDTGAVAGTYILVLFDVELGTSSVITRGWDGAAANGSAYSASISNDGRFITFESDASNLVPDDQNWESDVFVYDTQLKSTSRISVRSDGEEADGYSTAPTISGDGRVIAFESDATNLLSDAPTSGSYQIYVTDWQSRTSAVLALDASQSLQGIRGLIGFSDADLGDTHSVEVQPNATSWGTLTAVIRTDSTNYGTGGIIEWVYNVNSSHAYARAAGDTHQEVFTIRLNDGHGPAVERQVTVTLRMASAPILDASASPELVAADQEAGPPAGAVGTRIADLVDLAAVTGGLDNVRDIAGSETGIALIEADASRGTWWYSIDGGATWQALGVVHDRQALLLPADTGRLYFQASPGFTGDIAEAVTFAAWDRSAGAAGTYVDARGRGGDTALSFQLDTASIAVRPPLIGFSNQGGPNLLQNGSFENLDLGAWTVTRGNIDLVTTSAAWEPAEGQRSIDLNGTEPATLEQSFATVAGRSYVVSFALAGNWDAGNSGSLVHDLRVSAAGASADYQFDSTGRGQLDMGWSQRTFSFTATGSTTTLRFESLDPGNSGPAIDAVSVGSAPSVAVAEDTPTKLTGLSINGAVSGSTPLVVTLAIPVGTGSLAAASGMGVTVGGSPAALTLTGTAAALTAFLASANFGVTFTPGGNRSTDVTLTVTATDGGSQNGTKAILLDLLPVNDPPKLTGTAAVLPDGTEDQPYSVSTATLLQGFTDAEGHGLSIANLTASQGTVTPNGDGSYKITPPAHYNGAVTLTYTVVDGNGGETAAALSFHLGPDPDPVSTPVDADAGANEVLENAAVGTRVGLTGRAVDPDGEAVTYALVDAAGNPLEAGAFAIDPQTGIVTVARPLDHEAGSTRTLRIKATSADGSSSTSIFSISVLNVAGVTIEGTAADDEIGAGNTPPGQPLPTAEEDLIRGHAGHDDLDGLAGNDTLVGGTGSDNLRGGAGNDTLDGRVAVDDPDDWDFAIYAGDGGANGVVVDLKAGTAQDAYGHTDTLLDIEGVVGTRFADRLSGGNAENDTEETFDGLAGNDTIAGGSGIDVVSYELDRFFGGLSGVTVNLTTGQATDGFGDVDTLSGIEDAVGTIDSDIFVGDGSENYFFGLGGRDRFEGKGGNDVFDLEGDWAWIYHRDATTGINANLATGLIQDGQGGTDLLRNATDGAHIFGTRFNDVFVSGAAGGMFSVYGGNDTITGGTGSDGLDFDGASTGIFIDLTQSTVADGFGGTDTFTSIEDVAGTAHADTILGNAANNLFVGRGGDDHIDGRGGFDQYDLSWSAKSGVQVDLAAGTATDGEGGQDTLVSIENVEGSAFADTIRGDSAANRLQGGRGDDLLAGRGGVDTLSGGAGRDTLDGSPSVGDLDDFDQADYEAERGTRGVIVNLSAVDIEVGGETILAGTARDSFGDTDSLIDIEDVRGTLEVDTIVGSDRTGDEDGENLIGLAGADDLRGGLGIDQVSYTADRLYAGGANGVVVNLATGQAKDGFGHYDTLSGIENIAGSNFADALTGDALDNRFRGLGGADAIDGGLGTDEVDYRRDVNNGGAAGVIVNLSDTAWTVTGIPWFSGSLVVAGGTARDAFGTTDTLTSIENVRGTDQNDVLIGGTDDNRLRGEGGFDELYGRAGNDWLQGGGGDDFLVGGSGNDTLEGGGGGFSDYDIVSYVREFVQGGTLGVTVNLVTGQATDSFGHADRLIDIEEVWGTNLADTLIGGNTDNNDYEGFAGLGGSDVIQGGVGWDSVRYDRDFLNGGTSGVIVNLSAASVTVGDVTVAAGTARDGFGHVDTLSGVEMASGTKFVDTLVGDAFNNRFRGYDGNDILRGGAGFDMADYSRDERQGGGLGVIVNLSSEEITIGTIIVGAGQARDGFGATDTLLSIEEVGGTAFADALVGHDGNNNLWGYGGNDTLVGGGGYDWMVGGAGSDTLDGTASAEDTEDTDVAAYTDEGGGRGVVVNLADGTATDSFGHTDSLIDIEEVWGTAFADTLVGGRAVNDDYEGFYGFAGADAITGGSGWDQVIYSDDRRYGGLAGVTVDLVAGTAIDGFGHIDALSGIEAVVATIFNDALTGDGNNNRFRGLGGDDSIDGGGGVDEIDHRRDANFGGNLGVIVNLSTVAITADGVTVQAGRVRDGFGSTDTLTSIENARGTESRDVMLGHGGANWLRGEGGDDELSGNGGNDRLEGGAGSDFLAGGTGNDIINGGDGAFGEIDTVTYSGESAGGAVMVDFATGRATNAAGETDTLTGVEEAWGTSHDDTLMGGNVANDSIESFMGLDGADTITGGSGFDQVRYDRDARFGGGSHIILNLSGEAVTVGDITVASGRARDGFGKLDVLSGIEAVMATEFADALFGNSDNNRFRGLGGNDRIEGGDGRDEVDYLRDVLRGGNLGVIVNLSDTSVTVGSVAVGAGQARDGFGTTDTLSSIEDARGTAAGDVLVGSAGENRLRGDDGDDALAGGAGDDHLEGGLGEDVFRFESNSGRDTVSDFWAGDGATDMLDLSAFRHLYSFESVLEASEEVTREGGVDTVIDLNGGNTIVLAGIRMSWLRADDFLYGTPV